MTEVLFPVFSVSLSFVLKIVGISDFERSLVDFEKEVMFRYGRVEVDDVSEECSDLTRNVFSTILGAVKFGLS